MLDFAINHMSLANASYLSMLDSASALGCVGVEVRCDLTRSLFDGDTPSGAAAAAKSRNLRILSLAEIGAFDDYSQAKHDEAEQLMQIAVACGAEAIALIPRNDGFICSDDEREHNLTLALAEYKPLLEVHGLVGLIEPLGFTTSSLRSKTTAVAAIDDLQANHCYKLVHDTFHHFLAGEEIFFPEHTGLVHMSGVTDSSLAVARMQDAHRVFVDEFDRLDNIGQIEKLHAMGYQGPVSMEAFSPQVHTLKEPNVALSRSFNYIASSLAVRAA